MTLFREGRGIRKAAPRLLVSLPWCTGARVENPFRLWRRIFHSRGFQISNRYIGPMETPPCHFESSLSHRFRRSSLFDVLLSPSSCQPWRQRKPPPARPLLGSLRSGAVLLRARHPRAALLASHENLPRQLHSPEAGLRSHTLNELGFRLSLG